MFNPQIFSIPLSRFVSGAVLCLSLLLLTPGQACAQRGGAAKGAKPPQNTTTVDKKAEEAQQNFMKAQAELAKEYEELGDLQKAQEALRNILKISPGMKPVEEKIKSLHEQRMSQNESGVEVDPNRGWVPTRVAVEKGKTIRFVATGDCRLTVIQAVSPAGVSTEDVKTDMVAGVPLGGLMGMIAEKGGKLGKPFPIGEQLETTADTSGVLFLRVNIPPQTKATGRFRVQITGDIMMAD